MEDDLVDMIATLLNIQDLCIELSMWSPPLPLEIVVRCLRIVS